jgi:hypothetical protein
MLCLVRGGVHTDRARRRVAVRLVMMMSVGLAPWSARFFVSFNLLWLSISRGICSASPALTRMPRIRRSTRLRRERN